MPTSTLYSVNVHPEDGAFIDVRLVHSDNMPTGYPADSPVIQIADLIVFPSMQQVIDLHDKLGKYIDARAAEAESTATRLPAEFQTITVGARQCARGGLARDEEWKKGNTLMELDVSKQFNRLIEVARSVSEDVGQIVQGILANGLDQPLPREEARALLTRVIDVMREGALGRGDAKTACALSLITMSGLHEAIQQAKEGQEVQQ